MKEKNYNIIKWIKERQLGMHLLSLESLMTIPESLNSTIEL
jgi:hypothetical protein